MGMDHIYRMKLITTLVFRVSVRCLQLKLMTPCVSLLSCFIMIPFDKHDACIISENLRSQCITRCYLYLRWYCVTRAPLLFFVRS